MYILLGLIGYLLFCFGVSWVVGTMIHYMMGPGE